MRKHFIQAFVAVSAVLFLCSQSGVVKAQKLADAPSTVMLADSIQQQNDGVASVAQSSLTTSGSSGQYTLGASQSNQQPSSPVTAVPQQLTREEAEKIAIRNNPRVSVGQLLVLAQHQVYRQSRSGYLPQIFGGAVGAKANSGSRFTFDGLRSTRLLTHAGGGITLNQLITDFGRTSNLMASSKLLEKAQNANAMATQLDVVLVVDQAFYSALEAQALVKVAQQTVDTRQKTDQQIAVLTKNKLRSDIDLAFAEQNLAQANLLLLDARDQYNRDMNALTSVMGFDHPLQYELIDDTKNVPLPPPGADALVQLALKQRPDLMALDYDQQAAKKFSRAQHEQLLPTISTMGVVGGTPVRTDQYFTGNWFGAAGLNLEVPLFNGFLYNAEASEADDRAKAAQENLRTLRNHVVRDVRDAWLQTNTSYQKIGVTQKFLDAANLGLDLAQSRYKLGLSSIVELSQSQLQQTQAAIENVNSKYEYELSLAALNYQLGNLP